ncbi:MAG: hypothetical protein JO057_31225 [Chloroflexi bacterium]|nr:hypothetical protein [Chloroflexota bacterium]
MNTSVDITTGFVEEMELIDQVVVEFLCGSGSGAELPLLGELRDQRNIRALLNIRNPGHQPM